MPANRPTLQRRHTTVASGVNIDLYWSNGTVTQRGDRTEARNGRCPDTQVYNFDHAGKCPSLSHL